MLTVAGVRTTADAAAYWTPTPSDLVRVPAVAAHYWNSVDGPQRGWMLEAMTLLSPSSVLEIGCQSGPNLRILAHYFPTMRLTGLDLNEPMLDIARAFCAEAGMPVTFVAGRVPAALSTFADGSVDVVLSTFCLAYQDAVDVGAALRECLRIARRAVVLIEPMSEGHDELTTVEGSDYVEWRHDYRWLLESMMDDAGWIARPAGLRSLFLEKPPYDALTGVFIAVKEGADGQPIR